MFFAEDGEVSYREIHEWKKSGKGFVKKFAREDWVSKESFIKKEDYYISQILLKKRIRPDNVFIMLNR